jgi:hypothetical protein
VASIELCDFDLSPESSDLSRIATRHDKMIATAAEVQNW